MTSRSRATLQHRQEDLRRVRCVRDECLLYGLDEPYGLWGGYSPPERRAMRDRERWNNEKAATG